MRAIKHANKDLKLHAASSQREQETQLASGPKYVRERSNWNHADSGYSREDMAGMAAVHNESQ